MYLYVSNLQWMLNPWWHHQMEIFTTLLAICAENSPVTSEFPTQRPVTQSFDVFFDLSLNERLSKQSWGWWFQMPSCPLWHHDNASHVSFYTPRNKVRGGVYWNNSKLEWGFLNLHSLISLLSTVLLLQKYLLVISNHIHIWQVPRGVVWIYFWGCMGKFGFHLKL